jgi:hypothetical protein
MPRCCFALFATAKKQGQVINNRGEYKGDRKTAVDSPSLYQHKCKLIALSSLPCPAPILILFVILLSVDVLVFSPQKKDNHKHLQVGKRYFAWFVLFFFFGDYFFLILCVYAIRKNTSKQKRKTLFTLRFLPIAGRREGKMKV